MMQVEYSISILALLVVAVVVTVSLFLAAWERTRTLGLSILSFFAIVAMLFAAVLYLSVSRQHKGHGPASRLRRTPGPRNDALAKVRRG